MSKTSRRKFTTGFKSKVCLEAIKEQQTIEALSKKHDLHPTQINTWKKEFLEKAATVFDKEGSTTVSIHPNHVYKSTGYLQPFCQSIIKIALQITVNRC